MIKTISISKNQRKIIPILWIGSESEIIYTILLSGVGAEVFMPILIFGNKENKTIIRVNIYHQKPKTKSTLVVKGVLLDKSKVDFEGLVKIEKGAVKSDAWLESRLLLLSDFSMGRAVPNLEILENDVKAGHAATIGKVNDEELFYLMSRGLTKEMAIKVIVGGFIEKMLKDFPNILVNKYHKYVGI